MIYYKEFDLDYLIISYIENAYMLGHPSEKIIIPEKSILFSLVDNWVLCSNYDFFKVLIKQYKLERFFEV